ncbi:MAG: TOBE domain-containing protein [Campylobacterota bacterium]
MENGYSYHLQSRLFLTCDQEHFITPERIELLKSIAQTGSISAGAKEMGRSYKWAWDSIDQMNSRSNSSLVSKSSGGKGGGGAKITPFAIELIDYYDDLERIHQSKIESYQERFNQAFEKRSFTKDIASTLHGRVSKIECDEDVCEVAIEYGDTTLKAKCKKEMGLSKGDAISFMVEANQIIIAKQAVEISAQNLLVGEIEEIVEEEKKVYLTLRLSTLEELTVLITADSLTQFSLKLGQRCFAYFKTYNITILGENK